MVVEWTLPRVVNSMKMTAVSSAIAVGGPIRIPVTGGVDTPSAGAKPTEPRIAGGRSPTRGDAAARTSRRAPVYHCPYQHRGVAAQGPNRSTAISGGELYLQAVYNSPQLGTRSG